MIKGILINRILGIFGLKLSRIIEQHFTEDDKEFMEIYHRCKPYTMTSMEKMYSLYKAVEYVIKTEILGDIVECGVWRGGSAMLMAHTLLKKGQTERKFYLYDTYAGMTKPMDKDIDFMGRPAIKDWNAGRRNNFNKFAYCALEETKSNLFSTGYPKDKLIFLQGKVEETIPNVIPNRISVLHLDTDWYESTYHELRYLFPRLSVKGVLIIDDYDYFRGQREAVDKYFFENKIHILLNIIDGAGRIGIKLDI